MDASSNVRPRVNEGLSRSEPVEDTLRLSLSQREVWLDQRAWPESPHLNIGGGAYLEGPLNLARFRQALVCLVAESEALRLAPQSTGKQVLLPVFERDLEIVDLSASPEPRKAMRQWWSARIREPFVLDGTPPWRFTLLRGSDELYGLTIQFHHLIMDGWGTTQVMRRWSEIYNALETSVICPPSDAPGYRKFIAESHAYRDSPAYQDDAAYWRTQVPEVPAPLIERRYDYGGMAVGQLPQSRLVEQRIPRADYERVEQQAAGAGLTVFNYVLAALALYFARVNNVQEVVIGVPSLNRSGRAYKSTLGMFAGVLAVKIGVHPDMRVDELLGATRIAMRGALRHPRYPLSDLGRELEVIRHGRDGLMDIFLSFERQDYTLRFGDTPLVDARQLFSGSARYPLGVTVCDFHPGEDLELVLDASEACFAQGEPELLGRRLWHLVESMRAHPEAGIAQLSIVPNEEQWAILYGLHRDIATHEYPPPFISLFEHQVALRPEAPAVVWDDGDIDYATLNRRATMMAQRLTALGAGRDKVVAMAMARTCSMVVAMLAVSKTGAAFLPLDPDAPLERLADILEQSRACALMIDPAAGGRLGQLHPNIVRVRWNEPLSDTESTLPPLSAKPAPRDLAYVLFTSGSTGRPKGVMVEHAVLSRRLAWLSRAYGVDWRDCSGQSTQYTFDPSLIELLLPLINGGRVALPPPGRLLPETLPAFAARHGVTFIAFVPTTLQRYLDGAAGVQGLKLRVACCGGEVLSPALARRFVNETGARLFNVYGPTEASIFATAWQCLPSDDDTPLPIGRPIDDTRIYVLDAQLRPMPLGIPGEIYIGGDTLARGYLHRPELDAAVFLDDPFQPGSRMYKTGDRGWLGVEGNLHFVGRLDRQVKLRGYRIELGEIEAACLQVHGVSQAAARLVEMGGKPQIHAWVGAADHVTAQRLQSVLRQRLPDYMIPSAICVLPRLADSNVGKIDYDALPVQQPGALAEPARPPGTALERELVAIWESALTARPIGIQDNFFDIGGDSLAAVAILSAIDSRLGCSVPMYTLTEHPTIERLAIALGKKITPPDMIISLSAENGRTPLYLAASGHGDLLRFTELAKLVSNTYDVYMLQPPMEGKLKDVVSLAELYVNCIVAQGREPGVVAGFSVGGVAALETARLLKSSGAPARMLVLLDTIHPRSIVGGVGSWRALGWLVRTLRIQELSMNGRRLGGLVGDPGLVAQVMALRGFHPGEFDGHTCLVRSSGLANWDRLFFGKWRRLLKDRLSERRVPGLHGSIFEANNINELAAVLGGIMEERHAA
ncbi:amino acid adenylation domain-containing protein [Duganella sp. FT92W]|uniref:Amino acid adenylation domain-containing protein n=1 Tax=Pseudoduganella rivuli TaxID=2666085 RepID=A0A7X2INB5_9BURK|nr:non-ribosomal peptide synthetase [Pseudoduganella rivuli]MRV72727.1 amino acid adenylation domain-containing protein [Pseudoduganella rivuli]